MKLVKIFFALGILSGLAFSNATFAQNCQTQCSPACDFQNQQLLNVISQYNTRCGTAIYPPYQPRLSCLVGPDGYFWVTNVDTGARIDKRGAYKQDCAVGLKTFKDGLGCALGTDGYYSAYSTTLGRVISERNAYLKDCQASLATASKGFVCVLDRNAYYIVVNMNTGFKLTTRGVFLQDCIAQIKGL
ncbi:MAG: hypothetical protein JNL01_13275 [Bdellovibrionales bacterium]|nr:hypothetical protein [Bdellovibrionales bacterium]